jgi:hypothetical protein
MKRNKRTEGCIDPWRPAAIWPAIILVLIVLVLSMGSLAGTPSPYDLIRIAGETCTLGAGLTQYHFERKRSPRNIALR